MFLKNFTGGIGYNLSLFLNNLLGISSIIILILSLFLFIVFYFNVYSLSPSIFKNRNATKDFEDVLTEEPEEETGDYSEELVTNDDDITVDDEEIINEINNDPNEETNEDEEFTLKVEQGIDEKKSTTLTSNVYDPELDLSNYKYPKVDLLNDTTDKKIQVSKDELTSNKNRIIETLKNFKIEI